MRPLLFACAWLVAGCTPGGVEASRTESHTIELEGRVLVLDGFAGDVNVEADSSLEAAEVRLHARVRGATEASAEGLLGRIRIHQASDGTIHQVVWRTDLERAAVDAVARVPVGTDLVLRLGTGDIRVRGALGEVDAQSENGQVVTESVAE